MYYNLIFFKYFYNNNRSQKLSKESYIFCTLFILFIRLYTLNTEES